MIVDKLMIYFIQSQLSFILLFSLYMLVLRQQTTFLMNRLFLIVSILTSVFVPLIDFGFLNSAAIYYVQLPEIEIGITQQANYSILNLSTPNILLMVYAFISFIIIVKMIWDLISIFKLKNASKCMISKQLGIKFRLNSMQNFSFFNWIFIKESDINNDPVIEHEYGHARLWHSLDIILVKIFQSVFWVNPMSFVIEKELRLQHEYEVDQFVLRKHQNILDYQQMLLNQVFHTEFNLVTNNFNQSFLKKRFTMMTKRDNKKRRPLLLAFLFLASILTPMLFSCSMESKQEDNQVIPTQENKKTEAVIEEQADTDQLFMVVEEMPEFPGGTQALYQYIGKNLKYPEEAKKEGVHGRVVVDFIIEKDGKITNINIKQGIGFGCDEAAKDVISNMPAWSPGKQRGKAVRVKFALPFKFELQ